MKKTYVFVGILLFILFVSTYRFHEGLEMETDLTVLNRINYDTTWDQQSLNNLSMRFNFLLDTINRIKSLNPEIDAELNINDYSNLLSKKISDEGCMGGYNSYVAQNSNDPSQITSSLQSAQYKFDAYGMKELKDIFILYKGFMTDYNPSLNTIAVKLQQNIEFIITIQNKYNISSATTLANTKIAIDDALKKQQTDVIAQAQAQAQAQVQSPDPVPEPAPALAPLPRPEPAPVPAPVPEQRPVNRRRRR
jgi:hypothetical protein